MKRNGFDPPPVAPFLQIRGKLILSEAIENPVFRHSALAGHLDAPVREIELARGMGVGVDAHQAAEAQGRFMPAPVKIEPPWVGIDLDRDAVLGTRRKHLLDVDVVAGAASNCRPVI